MRRPQSIVVTLIILGLLVPPALAQRQQTSRGATVQKTYLDPSRMAIVIVGDRKVIEPGLRSLDEIGGTITFVDTEGRPVAKTAGEGTANPQK